MKAKARVFMTVKIWMVIYPSITAFLLAFGPALSALPLYQRTFVLTIALVPWMMFVGVPVLDFLLRRIRKAGQNVK
jgi:antibiotic biosynthesis monooxygenase (ABM) superfamily enzyme